MTGPMIIRTSFVQAGDELEIAYRPWGSPRFGGLPVVPVHGDWSTSGAWTRVASELTERWLLAPDLRGRGRTRAPDNGYSIAELAADLLAFLDALELSRVHLIGHELGAAVAAQLALQVPDRVASLTLISMPSIDGTPVEDGAHERIEAWLSNSRTFSAAQAERAPASTRDMLWATLIEAGHKQRRTAALATLDALASWKPGDRLARLGMPCRVVRGELDAITSAELSTHAAEVLGCQHVNMPRVGHHPPLESPVKLAELIRTVMAECR